MKNEKYILALVAKKNGKEFYYIDDEKYTLKIELAKIFSGEELKQVRETINNINSHIIDKDLEYKLIEFNNFN